MKTLRRNDVIYEYKKFSETHYTDIWPSASSFSWKQTGFHDWESWYYGSDHTLININRIISDSHFYDLTIRVGFNSATITGYSDRNESTCNFYVDANSRILSGETTLTRDVYADYARTYRHLNIKTYFNRESNNDITVALHVDGESGSPNVFEALPVQYGGGLRVYCDITYTYRYEVPTPKPLVDFDVTDPTMEQRQFYVDYQRQPWHNKLLPNEQSNVIVVQEKKYDFFSMVNTINDIVKLTIPQIPNDYLQLSDGSTITDIYGNNIPVTLMQETVKFNDNYTLSKFLIPKIDNGTGEYNTKYYCDDIFSYKFIVCKGTGKVKHHNDTTGVDFNKTNTWFIVPVTKVKYANNNEVWGINNDIETIKNDTTIGSEAAITAVYESKISPFVIAFWNRINQKEILDIDPKVPDDQLTIARHIYDVYRINGMYDYISNNKSIGVIPINGNTITVWLEKNEFIQQTNDYLNLINENPANLPTVIDNEPIKYSPQCFLSFIKAINNNFNPIGNDLINLKYKQIFNGLKTSLLSNNTVMYNTNFFNDKRMLSMSKNELIANITAEIPFSTTAYTNWLNNNSTTKDTSYEMFNLTSAQRRDNYATQCYLNNINLKHQRNQLMTNSIFGGVGGVGIGGVSGMLGSTANKLKGFIAGALGGGIFGLTKNISRGAMELRYAREVNTAKERNAYNQMITNNKIDQIALDSEYANIQNSSGKDTILPSFTSGAFAKNEQLSFYTTSLTPESKNTILFDRLIYGVSINEIHNFKRYDNRQWFNVISVDPTYNFYNLKNVLALNLWNNWLMEKYKEEYINYFLANYLTGITLFKKAYRADYWKITQNYENDIFHTKAQLDNIEDTNYGK